MKRLINIMLDLEFMSLQPNAAIVQIGAVVFDPFGDPDAEIPEIDRFLVNVDLADSIRNGGHIDGDTVRWWLQQSDEARVALTDPPPLFLSVALSNFSRFVTSAVARASQVEDPFGAVIWGNGTIEDNIKLRTAFERLQLLVPWSFRGDRCYRSVAAFLDPESVLPRQQIGTHHCAVDDAESQARHLQQLIRASGARPLSGESDLPQFGVRP